MFDQSSQHVGSYYAATTNTPSFPNLDETLDADVVIVGAGFAGLHAALQLQMAGKQVILLEASRVAWAASGRNGGMAILGWSSDMAPLEAELGHEGALRLWQLMQEAATEVKHLSTNQGIDCDYVAGHLWASVLPRRVANLHEWQDEASRKWGYHDLQFISKSELPQWIQSNRYQAALYDPNGAHLHPLKFAHGLAKAFISHGGRIFEQTKVTHYQQSGTGVQFSTQIRGQNQITQHRCAALVLACNAYIDQLDIKLSQRILSAGTYIATTHVLGESVCKSLLPTNACVTDNQFILDYFRITADHRLLFGGGNTYLGSIPSNIPQAIAPHLQRVFPQLQNVQFDYGWGGHIDLSMRRTPNVGRQGAVYWLLGFSGHGVLPTRAASKAVVQSLLGQDENIQLFQKLHHPAFPGGKMLAPILEATGKLYYRLRDLI